MLLSTEFLSFPRVNLEPLMLVLGLLERWGSSGSNCTADEGRSFSTRLSMAFCDLETLFNVPLCGASSAVVCPTAAVGGAPSKLSAETCWLAAEEFCDRMDGFLCNVLSSFRCDLRSSKERTWVTRGLAPGGSFLVAAVLPFVRSWCRDPTDRIESTLERALRPPRGVVAHLTPLGRCHVIGRLWRFVVIMAEPGRRRVEALQLAGIAVAPHQGPRVQAVGLVQPLLDADPPSHQAIGPVGSLEQGQQAGAGAEQELEAVLLRRRGHRELFGSNGASVEAAELLVIRAHQLTRDHQHHAQNLRVRTVSGPQYQCQSGAKFSGALEQRFILVDCKTVLYGTYSLSEPNEDKEKTATAVDGSKELKSSRAAPLPLTGAQVLETLAHRKKRVKQTREFGRVEEESSYRQVSDWHLEPLGHGEEGSEVGVVQQDVDDDTATRRAHHFLEYVHRRLMLVSEDPETSGQPRSRSGTCSSDSDVEHLLVGQQVVDALRLQELLVGVRTPAEQRVDGQPCGSTKHGCTSSCREDTQERPDAMAPPPAELQQGLDPKEWRDGELPRCGSVI
ncbi:hypothetical protein CRUP_001086 [Coryphaenoides rupestris]|nr:hypothetical protein CRUP_001086 [Coryphaenoides rupestris]